MERWELPSSDPLDLVVSFGLAKASKLVWAAGAASGAAMSQAPVDQVSMTFPVFFHFSVTVMSVCWIQTAGSAIRWTTQLSSIPPVFQLIKLLQMRQPGAGMSRTAYRENVIQFQNEDISWAYTHCTRNGLCCDIFVTVWLHWLLLHSPALLFPPTSHPLFFP